MPSSLASSATLVASPEPGWPQFRGPRRDGISDEKNLLQSWPAAGPKLLWTAQGAGRGFSSTIIGGGRLYVTGDFEAEVRILAYSLDGQPLWSARNGDAWLNQYPGARSSVTYRDGRLYHQNAHGRLACLEAATGRELWAVDLLARFRGENITWGLSECLLVDDRAVFSTAGGRDALIVAFDRTTGALLWKSAPVPSDKDPNAAQTPSYAAPILIEFADRRLIIGCGNRALYCVDASTGTIQWTRPRPTNYGVLAMAPVLVGDAVFMAAPLGPPGQLYRLIAPARPGDTVGVSDAWTNPIDTCQGGIVHVGGRLYGSTYPRRGSWAAIDAATGTTLYETAEFAKGSTMFADGRLYTLTEDGWMLLLEPTAEKFEVRGRYRLPGTSERTRDAWAHPVIHQGRLYLRYHDTVVCYDILANPS
ncbi:MAG: PQQ-binding-like beta-propeller repeat protein [Opitutaceae bacterium]|nr:PQQ-binding-like beta-propeller repeat protein [Opitutaceae bacterium]